MQNKGYQVFTHKDLDGAVSLLTFLWSHPDATVTYREITNMDTEIVKEYVKKTCNPPNILLMDIPLKPEFLPELDYEYITFIDHHERSKKYIPEFKQAKIIHSEEPSNSILVRKTFKDVAPEFNDRQKKMILYANDYDCGEFVYEESYNLNILFWTQFRNQFCYFIDYYKGGFKEFSEKQKEIIQHTRNNAKIAYTDTKIYTGDLLIQGNLNKVFAAITDNYNNIVIDMIMERHNPDILFYINPRTEKVYMRQNKKSKNPINLLDFAEKYCEGGGHINAAHGKMTPLFMEVTKKLKPL